jgi:hypothetical protein
MLRDPMGGEGGNWARVSLGRGLIGGRGLTGEEGWYSGVDKGRGGSVNFVLATISLLDWVLFDVRAGCTGSVASQSAESSY